MSKNNFSQHALSVSYISEQIINGKFWTNTDVIYMQQALLLARKAADLGEVPVGAILVDMDENRVLGTGFNQPICLHDPTAHAEIMALREACTSLNNYRLPKNATLYVTLEPCTMCVGALIHARLNRLVFATNEPRSGMVGSQHNLLTESFYNHQVLVNSGLMATQSANLLRQFFKTKRSKK